MNTNSYYGKNNSNWKGGSVSDRAKHYRITAKRGKASEHKCAFCGKRGKEWARMKDGSYKSLCKSCHSRYDHKEHNCIKESKEQKLREELLSIARNI